MKLEELALIMKITKEELIEQLKQNAVVELKLTERENGMITDDGSIEIIE